MSARWRSTAPGRPAPSRPGDRPEPLGRHVGEGPAAVGAGVARASSSRSTARLKSKSIGVPSAVKQDVGRLQVAVGDPPAVGVVERLGEPGDDPGQGPGMGEAAEDLAGRPRQPGGRDIRGPTRGRGRPGGRGPTGPVGRASAAPRGPSRQASRPPRNGMQIRWRASSSVAAWRRTSTMWACRARARSRGSAGRPGRDLDDHQPVVEVGLLGEEDPGERPPAQLADQVVGPDLVAGRGEVRTGSAQALSVEIGQGPVEGEDPAQERRPPARGTVGDTRPGRGRGPTPRPGNIRGRSARPSRPEGPARGTLRPAGGRRVPSSR